MQLKVQNTDLVFGSAVNRITVPEKLKIRYPTGVDFMDDAFGGAGITPSVCALISGTPGAGKTSLLLKMADGLAKNGHLAVYNSAEESAFQIKLVADRLGLKGNFGLGQEICTPRLLEKFDKVRNVEKLKDLHAILIVDSLQALDDGHFQSGRITSASAERSLEMLTSYAKENWCNVFVIGQVTKSGAAAGTNKLQHMVDARLHLSVETSDKSEFKGCRKLETIKNRFGGAGFASYLQLGESGFTEVARFHSEF